MKKKLVGIIMILIFMFTATSCNRNEDDNYTSFSNNLFDAFDTYITFTSYAKTNEEFEKTFKIVKDEFKRLHKLYDIYNDYEGINNVKTINDNAGKTPVKVDKDIIELLKFSKEMAEKYSDQTNIAFGSVLKIWHDYREEALKEPDKAKIPTMEELQEAAKHTDINKVIINEEDGTVFLEDGKMSLDIGATSKGYASQIVMDKVKESGCKSAILNAGGNVISLGKPMEKDRNKWGIGLQKPIYEESAASGIIDTVYGNDISVVTSGDYQRYFEVDGKIYNHIIDPKTLMPGEYFKAVTVVGKDSGVADYFSTTLFLMTEEDGKKLIEKVDGVEATWIHDDNSITSTKGMKKYLKSLGAKAED